MSSTVVGWLFGGWSFGKRDTAPRAPLHRGEAVATAIASGYTRDDELSDPAFLARFRAGDNDAFKIVFDLYWDMLCAVALRYVPSVDTAEDIVQTVFLRLAPLRPTWPKSRSLRGFLLLATRNMALNATRDERRRASYADAIKEASPVMPLPPDSPDLSMDEAETAAAVRAAIESLSPRGRTVIILRMYEGLSRAEIATAMGISEHTVHRHLTLATDALRDRLQRLR